MIGNGAEPGGRPCVGAFAFTLESVGAVVPSWRPFAALAYLVLVVSCSPPALVPSADG
jgi:hypothetical protein